MKKNIYPQGNQALNKKFNLISPDKLLLVPIDYAKKEHTAQLCLGTGELLLNKAMRIYNNTEGVIFLEKQIFSTSNRMKINRENIIICMEDPPGYVQNFTDKLLFDGFTCVRVNAKDAKKFRTNSRVSNDILDLNGIAQAVINRRCRPIETYEELYSTMKEAARTRKRLVKETTSLKNRIHKYVDLLFPGFLTANNGLDPFSGASMELLGQNFSVIKIKRMRRKSLIKILCKHHINNANEVATQLQLLAQRTLCPSSTAVAHLSKSLTSAVELYFALNKWIMNEENTMARCLVQSPGFYLTSIPGIGVVLAAVIMGEFGGPGKWKNSAQQASNAGICNRIKQTGGPDKPAIDIGLSRNCNRRLKDALLQVGFNMGKFKHPAGKIFPRFAEHHLHKHFWRVDNRGSKSGLSTAKKFIGIASQMISCQQVYLDKVFLKNPNSISSEENLGYFLSVLELLKQKWSRHDLSGIPDEKNYLKKEIKCIKDYSDYVNKVRTS